VRLEDHEELTISSASPPQDYASWSIADVVGAEKRGGVVKYSVIWEGSDHTPTLHVLEADTVKQVWHDDAAEEWIIGKFVMVAFTNTRRHLGKVIRQVPDSIKYEVIYEDGHNNEELDLLQAEKSWKIADPNQTFELKSH